MNRIENAINELTDFGSNSRNSCSSLCPQTKLLITLFYLLITASFPKDNLTGLLSMTFYPLFNFIYANISFSKAVRRLRFVLPVVCLMGISNLFFDKTIVYQWYFPITSGMISFASLTIKGILTVSASYILFCTTSPHEICNALKAFHLPDIIVLQISLTFRYITLLLTEVNKINQSYQLRSPNQKGIKFSAWGSLTGTLLLRSFDRAQEIFQAMILRGYKGRYFFYSDKKMSYRDIIILILFSSLFITFRFIDTVKLTGGLV